MHELSVTKRILDIVLSHGLQNQVKKIVSISLQVGELSDLEDEWIQHYFSHLAKGTLAAEAKLKIERLPVIFRCTGCSREFRVDIKEMKEIRCPDCGNKQCTLTSGKEYFIKDMEAV